MIEQSDSLDVKMYFYEYFNILKTNLEMKFSRNIS